MSDKALAEHIAAFVRHNRLMQNKPQNILAQDAGISRSTLSLLERGRSSNIGNLNTGVESIRPVAGDECLCNTGDY